MKHLTRFDHIGYAVKDIKKTAAVYLAGGYKLSETFEEKVQNTKIAFLTKEGFPTIELVSPLDGESPVDGFLEKIGVTPYHLCYEVDDIDDAFKDMCEEGFIPLFMPVESIAMDNRKICYLFNRKVGYIEIVNSKK